MHFFSKMLTSPEVMQHPSFFNADLAGLEKMFVQTCFETCELARKKEKEKKQEAFSAAVEVQIFKEIVDPQQHPSLVAKNIVLTSDEDITPVLRDVVKPSKKVKSVDLLKVLNFNDKITSLVAVPCSAKQSGFKKQARKSRWVHRLLECMRRHKEEELVDEADEGNDDDNNEIAYRNDDAARWLITYLGDSYPKEFVKSAQALDMPMHQGKMDAEHATAMWSDAGVGVAAQRVIMKHFITHFGCKFTVSEASINKLAVHLAPPIVGTIDHMDAILNFWCKDLVDLVSVQIAGEHKNRPEGFSYLSVDLVIGADHGQGSFRAGVKVIHRDLYQSVKATALYGLGEIECAKDTGDLLALAFLPRLNAALKRIIKYERDGTGKLSADGTLSVCKKNRGAEGDADPTFYAILDRTGQTGANDTLENSVPIRVFITGDLAFYATVLGKEGMDKAHCMWCELKKAEWQADGHERGVKWTLEELKRVACSLNGGKTENGVKSYPQLDCVELERFMFPVSHVTLGLANRLLKHAIDYAVIVVERTPASRIIVCDNDLD
jgi:hypothetical protein